MQGYGRAHAERHEDFLVRGGKMIVRLIDVVLRKQQQVRAICHEEDPVDHEVHDLAGLQLMREGQ